MLLKGGTTAGQTKGHLYGHGGPCMHRMWSIPPYSLDTHCVSVYGSILFASSLLSSLAFRAYVLFDFGLVLVFLCPCDPRPVPAVYTVILALH